MNIWTFINSSVGLLLVGFLLTTIAGSWLSTFFQRKSWERQTKMELYKKRYEEGTHFLDELSELIGKRYYLLKRLMWEIEKNDAEKIALRSSDYFNIVELWNVQYYKNRNKIRLLANEEMANRFLRYADDSNSQNPQSVHYNFVLAHRLLMNAQQDANKMDLAQSAINQLNWTCSAFLEELTAEFTFKAQRLELLDI